MNYTKAFVLSILALLAPIHAVMLSALILVFIDLVTGVWAALKKKETISSAKLRSTVTKLLIYQCAIISAFLVEQYMQFDLVPVVKLVSGMIGVVELKSVLENLNKISGKDLFKLIINKLGSHNLPKD